jgi:hypothetical protein
MGPQKITQEMFALNEAMASMLPQSNCYFLHHKSHMTHPDLYAGMLMIA